MIRKKAFRAERTLGHARALLRYNPIISRFKGAIIAVVSLAFNTRSQLAKKMIIIPIYEPVPNNKLVKKPSQSVIFSFSHNPNTGP
jgi:hypothetical protein